ncbi:MAG TPA: cupin domain-containing protein [Bacteroidales bacterium]|nr:cupin domain-containing protein [Bacteroidales bacterium]
MDKDKNLIELGALQESEPVAGYKARFVHTDNMTFAFWDIKQGHEVPQHSHPHEQVVKVLEGTLELVLDGLSYMLSPGLVLIIPPNTPHSAYSHTDCKAIDTFYPIREDYKTL